MIKTLSNNLFVNASRRTWSRQCSIEIVRDEVRSRLVVPDVYIDKHIHLHSNRGCESNNYLESLLIVWNCSNFKVDKFWILDHFPFPSYFRSRAKGIITDGLFVFRGNTGQGRYRIKSSFNRWYKSGWFCINAVKYDVDFAHPSRNNNLAGFLKMKYILFRSFCRS